MKDEKEKWINDVFESLQNRRPTAPNPDLFDKIESAIPFYSVSVISLFQIKLATAAAILLLIFNLAVLQIYNKSQKNSTYPLVQENSFDESILSNFNLYEL